MKAEITKITSEDELKERYFRVAATINLDAICNNIKMTKKLLSETTKIMAIIKADGYGHGAIPIAKALDEIGIDAYGIAIVEEAIELRDAGIKKPLLVLGYTPKEQLKQLVEYDINQTVFQYGSAKELSIEAMKQNKIAKIHIKVDTGMTRIGFTDTEESIEEIKKIALLKGIKITGILSHFACADERDKTSAQNQLRRFLHFVNRLEEEGIHIPNKHIANSAAIIDMPEANFDMVRSGISTYGLYPSDEVDKSKLPLEPAMEIRSHVSYIHEVGPGVGIGYGSTFVTSKNMKIATIPVGYGDGYPRQLSSKGRVLVHGQSAAILGRICMDQFMVDVSEIEHVEQGDVVTLVGKDGNEFITVEELANMAGSFNYEFVCNVGKRIPRLYYHNNKIIEVRE